MASELFATPARATDSNGDSLSGAKWYFYATGTTTPQNVYSDSTLATSLGSTVTADSGGKFVPIYLDPGQTYRAVLKTSDGATTIYDIDPVGGNGSSRESLLDDRTYYVRTDGSDANDGLANTSGRAFLTMQKAIDVVWNELDLAGNVVTINVADGTYTAGIEARGLPPGATADQPIRLTGNESTPANVVISVTNGNGIALALGAYLRVAGITTQTTTGGVGWSVQSNSMLEHRNCRFGNCANEMILTQHHATVRALGTTTVAGNAQYFCHATKRSIIDFAGRTIAFSGTPTFSTYLWGINDASVNLDSGTITGSAVGPILVHKNGSLNASSLTGSYLGGSAPVVNDGGYIFVQDLLETRTVYVRSGGNDNNDGLVNTDARAFATINGAITYLAKLPFNALWWTTAQDSGFLIQVANGTYAETVNLRDLQTVGGTIRGDEVNPSNVVVAGVTDGFVSIGLSTTWFLRGLTISAAAGSSIRTERGSRVIIQNVRFGAASVAHMSAQTGSFIVAEGNYTIAGAAAWHKIARGGALIMTTDRTVTLTGTPAFSQSYAFADDTSLIRAPGMTFSGSATGKRYDVATNGVINTNGGGATYLPGNVGGSTASGGQYV